MNKAFVKEAESGDSRCPRCGNLGIAVKEPTLVSFVRPEFLLEIAKTAYFCDFPRCPVVYFDDFERVLTADQLQRPVWPKDPDAPICGCFGLTADDIQQDVREGTVQRVKEAVTRAKSSEAQCTLLSPSGQSCAAAIQRHYFKVRDQR